MALSKIQNNSFEDAAVHGRRNLIINGAMQVAQRGTSETGVTSTGVFVLDRFKLSVADTAEYTVSQSTTTPDGFANSMKWDNTTANASPSSGQYALFSQNIEGQNLQHLKYGTASAQSMTLSFWVRSNKTGTYVCELLTPDSPNRHINKSYTISSADTWEHKTITFPGDTSGVINNDNGNGLSVTWWLGAGSAYSSGTLQTSWGALDQTARAVGNVNLSDSTSNEWYITGVQLEVGDKATPFEHRSFAEELVLCERYFQKTYKYSDTFGTNTSEGCINFVPHNTADSYSIVYSQEMRANPSVTTTRKNGGANSSAQRGDNSGNYNALTIANIGTRSYDLDPGTAAARNYRFHHKLDAEF
jgi:lipoprotein-anchoring transpeptidase ErfK/SrfK